MKRGSVASELRAEPGFAVQVGAPESHRYRGEDMTRREPLVSAERAQARNLGGTAKQPVARKRGRGGCVDRRTTQARNLTGSIAAAAPARRCKSRRFETESGALREDLQSKPA